MHDLLQTYVQGLTEMGGNTKHQHLLIVFSKGDKLKSNLENWREIWQYLENGGLESLRNKNIKRYLGYMKEISNTLKEFVEEEIKGYQFLNLGDSRFNSMEFSIISALGAEPDGDRLTVALTPKRVIDPILWLTYKSIGWFGRLLL